MTTLPRAISWLMPRTDQDQKDLLLIKLHCQNNKLHCFSFSQDLKSNLYFPNVFNFCPNYGCQKYTAVLFATKPVWSKLHGLKIIRPKPQQLNQLAEIAFSQQQKEKNRLSMGNVKSLAFMYLLGYILLSKHLFCSYMLHGLTCLSGHYMSNQHTLD